MTRHYWVTFDIRSERDKEENLVVAKDFTCVVPARDKKSAAVRGRCELAVVLHERGWPHEKAWKARLRRVESAHHV